MKFVKGPDFPTGCSLCGLEGVKNYFTTGRGNLKVRGKVGVEELKGGREQIVITEIPYNVNRAVLVERIAELVNEKIITDITAVRDESDENTRVVIEAEAGCQSPRWSSTISISTRRWKAASRQTPSPSITGGPRRSGSRKLINCYIEHRREVSCAARDSSCARRRSAPKRWKGYLIALSNLDEFIRIIRGSATRDEARIKLLAFEFPRAQVETMGILIRSEARLTNGRYAFSEAQANAILEPAPVPIDRPGNRQGPGRIPASCSRRSRTCWTSWRRKQRVLAIIKNELLEIRKRNRHAALDRAGAG